MPAYHSKKNGDECQEACACSLLPLKTDLRGPASPCPADKEDIIDEVLNLFRANVLFRNFEVLGGADRTLIYLTLHVVQCLVKCERIEDKQLALKELRALSTKAFPAPGEVGWTLGGLFPTPSNMSEANLWKTYMKQAREELALRLCDRLFDGPASKNKWWQAFSKRKFMGKELKD
mmetsp:Transcript_33854/g.24890  ORF Transcript_33854/g.24890 Transcript_33854/m.24890 type:complete len:176 (-) Transcript_33854:152-679(-)|eukprot:CAMPEP_0202973486 /NCGR_PEP_ID=MMETSP1396-20130829/50484_1 /ASSEMBLY_ACC=CAM_ASM_000872 /TAXON_ID= /ORGANISM="Pseudokeronopsis sp., Strain Brazil" /LENGTH=175 /DNA_ID=CAMNT_0049705599 /DNA_START=78 /DNA_END=605 /DNA_ORIENTATION=+